MRIAFWNTGKNRINKLIFSLIAENNVDLIGLAEYQDDINELIGMLSKSGRCMDRIDAAGCERVLLIGDQRSMQQAFQSRYCSMQIINETIIACCMHLRSDVNEGEGQRQFIIQDIVREAETYSVKSGIPSIVYFGDMNENPYQTGCLGADKFHALPSRMDAQKGVRRIPGSDRQFRIYYNPMWSLLGDFSYPPGTYYYDRSGKTVEPFWHMLDQVIISADMIDSFVKEELKIITAIDKESLLDQKMRPRKSISDHLPILFEIKKG